MFTWICPQCGREVPPSHSECPSCAEARMKAQQPAAPQYTPPQQPVPQQWTPPAPQQPQWTPQPPQQPQWGPQAQPQQPWAPPQQQVYTIGENNQKKGMPAWLVFLLVVVGLGGALFGFYRYMGKGGEAAKTEATEPFEQPARAGAAGGHPYSKHLEIAGLRLSEEGTKVKVQFVVVNHSGAEMAGLELKVALQSSAAKPDDPPLAVVNAKVGSLAPYEVKDLTAQVQTKLRAYELPDWQFLRATFEVTSPK